MKESAGVPVLRDRVAVLWRQHLRPRPRLTVSEWADKYRVVSSYSAEPGPWRTDRTPYLREIMDAFNDPAVQTVVFMKCARIGGTEAGLNVVGYFIDQDPSPILIVQPAVDDAKDFSKEQLAPMLEDTPALKGKVRDSRLRDSGNTLQAKTFPGGGLFLVGANSARGFRRRTVRVVDLEEVDGFPQAAGSEGDQVALAVRRTTTFGYRRKVYMNSTPTIKGTSRIEKEYAKSDQRQYHVPCPHCGEYQPLLWKNLHFQEDGPPKYLCRECGVLISEEQKFAMLRAGRWVAARPGVPVRGYHINALYSPWVTWAELEAEWKASEGDSGARQVFVNTALGEVWEERGGALDPGGLYARREPYEAEVPEGVGLLTAGVDVQADRLELFVQGWGAGEESWLIAREVIPGDPSQADTWAALDPYLTREYRHASGRGVRIHTTCVDSGYHTEAVHRFCAPRFVRRVYAVKGSNVAGHELVKLRPKVVRRAGTACRRFDYGPDAAKDMVYGNLRVPAPVAQTPRPGRVHFPVADWCDLDYFHQLTSERRVWSNEGGKRVSRYRIIGDSSRNEALDGAVMCRVALALSRVRAEKLAALAASLATPPDAIPTPTAAEATPAVAEPAPAVAPLTFEPAVKRRVRPPKFPKGGGWVNGWK